MGVIMSGEIEPEKGKWYYRFDKGKNFTVLDVDEVESVVMVQYLGGDTDQIALHEWGGIELEKAE